jgi:hypothetical protein
MAEFVAFDPNVEVSGRAVKAVLDGMGVFQKKAREILADQGIDEVRPDGWYPQQAWLDAFRTICDTLGSKQLFDIGRKIPETASWPANIEDIRAGLRSINTAYQMNHRGGPIGSYDYFDIDTNTARMICNNPYPDDFDHGLITAVADRYKPAGTFMVEVKIDQGLPSRSRGADFTSYLVTW